MGRDTEAMTSGPANVTIADTAISHTQGGVTATFTPQNRMRMVDEYGQGAIDVVHLGDEVRVTVPWAQYDADTLAEVYAAGLDETGSASNNDYMGVGRKTGFVYTAKDMKITPLITADAAKRIHLWRSVPIGAIEQVFDNGENDRILSCEYAGLVDQDQVDGALIGKIEIADS